MQGRSRYEIIPAPAAESEAQPKPAKHTVRACTIEMHMGMSQEPRHARIYRENAGAQDQEKVASQTLREPSQSKLT